MEIDKRARIKHAPQHFQSMRLQPIARETMGNQGVVVRPDGAIVVRHGIVARFAVRDRANSPTGERRIADQRVGGAPRPLVADDPGHEAVSRIGGAYSAGPLVAVQRQGIGGEVVAPEGALETLLQDMRLALECGGLSRMAERSRQNGRRPFRRKHIPLNLAKSDGSLRQRAVRMKNGIVRIFPPLLD